MQFLAHLPLETGAISVFFCQNDPGMCDDWDATAGGNRAFLFVDELRPAAVPAEGATLLGAVTALALHPDDAPAEVPVLGQWGGTPDWLQGDETPACPSCTSRMTFVAALEEGCHFATEANFGGGGRGFVFACQSCSEAAFLWQC
jgi:hypothetical protein